MAGFPFGAALSWPKFGNVFWLIRRTVARRNRHDAKQPRKIFERVVAGQAGSAAWLVAVDQDPLGGAIEILILAAPQGPQEPGQPKRSEEQGHRYEVGERRHEDCASAPMSERLSCRASCTDAFDTKPCRRSALPMTRRDEADIATAAISGVTCPRMATGTAMPL